MIDPISVNRALIAVDDFDDERTDYDWDVWRSQPASKSLLNFIALLKINLIKDFLYMNLGNQADGLDKLYRVAAVTQLIDNIFDHVGLKAIESDELDQMLEEKKGE